MGGLLEEQTLSNQENIMNTKEIVVLSGGMDSTVLLADRHQEVGAANIVAITIDYGQRHRKEITSAKQVAGRYKADHRVVDLYGLRTVMTGSSQTDSQVPVPHGHYAAETMKQTVVPNRNMILLSVAGALAISVKASTISYGAHSGDHAIYPDCREEFVRALEGALQLADWHPVRISRPFIGMTKAEIVALGMKLGAPFEMTWSCYEGNEKACGKCGTCCERLEAFHIAGAEDPLQYEDREFWKTVNQH